MLTIFTIPKPFTNSHISIIQKNAIQSWKKLGSEVEIILYGSDYGVKEVAEELKLVHTPEIKKNEFGVPLINDIFEKVQKVAHYDVLAYINADIILMNDFMKAIEKVKELKPTFLIIGQRWDLDVQELVQFSLPDWEEKIRSRLVKESKLHGLSASDYFVFPGGINWNMPPFSVGRTSYDNWFIYYIRSLKIPVIDATEVVTVIHQNHSPHKQEDGAFKTMRKKNIKLAGSFLHMCNLLDADWILSSTGLRRPSFPRRIFAEMSLFYPWRLLLSTKRKLQNL
jgi:hypothetical protein